MKKIFFKQFNFLIEFDKNIKKCNIESSSIYRETAINIKDLITYSSDDIPLDVEKNAFIIHNPYIFNINDTKNLKYLYKNLEINIKKNFLNDVIKLESDVLELIEIITNDFDFPLDYNENIDLQKLFVSVGLEFKEPTTYIEKLVYYIKLIKEINKISLIISFGLLNLLEENEIDLLEKELIINEIVLIDFNLSHKNANVDIIIDQDWCII